MARNERDSYKRLTHNFSPQAREDVSAAAKIHGTTFKQELMNGAGRNRTIAELEEQGMRIFFMDSRGRIQGEVPFDEADFKPEAGDDLPANVIPLHADSF